MKREQLDLFLTQIGYNKIPSNLPEYALFFRPENQGTNVISIVDCSKYAYMTADQYDFVKGKIRELFDAHSAAVNAPKDLHILSLIVSDDWEKNGDLFEKDRFCWMISPTRDQLAIYETQTPDFYGLRSELEQFLIACRQREAMPVSEEDHRTQETMIERREISWSVDCLIVCNVIVFILCAFAGEVLYNIGGLGAREVVQNEEYYRLVSSMFLHADLEHLFSNMLLLYYIGSVVEKCIGHVRFVALYFLAGICGSVMSMGYEMLSGKFYYSVGASGAVFGIMGALLLLVALKRGQFREMTLGRVVFMISFSLYSGFTADNINNAAHVGGLAGGIVLMGILWLTMGKERRNI